MLRIAIFLILLLGTCGYRVSAGWSFPASHPVLEHIGAGAGWLNFESEPLQILIPKENCCRSGLQAVDRTFGDFSDRHFPNLILKSM